ncbi:Hypothetical protein, putative, partial [Bodo saltans]
VAVAPDGKSLFVSISMSRYIARIDLKTGNVTNVVANATTPFLVDDPYGVSPNGTYEPYGVLLMPDASVLIVADHTFDAVRCVKLAGTVGVGAIVTIAGNGTGGYADASRDDTASSFMAEPSVSMFNAPQGMGWWQMGNSASSSQPTWTFLVADYFNGAVRAVTLQNDVFDPFPPPELYNKTGVTAISTSILSAALTSMYQHQSSNIVYAVRSLTQIISLGGQVTVPSFMIIAGNTSTTSGTADGAGNAARFQRINGMTGDDGGEFLYVADNNTVRRVSITGAHIVTTLIHSSPSTFNAIALGLPCKLFVAGYNTMIYMVDLCNGNSVSSLSNVSLSGGISLISASVVAGRSLSLFVVSSNTIYCLDVSLLTNAVTGKRMLAEGISGSAAIQDGFGTKLPQYISGIVVTGDRYGWPCLYVMAEGSSSSSPIVEIRLYDRYVRTLTVTTSYSRGMTYYCNVSTGEFGLLSWSVSGASGGITFIPLGKQVRCYSSNITESITLTSAAASISATQSVSSMASSSFSASPSFELTTSITTSSSPMTSSSSSRCSSHTSSSSEVSLQTQSPSFKAPLQLSSRTNRSSIISSTLSLTPTSSRTLSCAPSVSMSESFHRTPSTSATLPLQSSRSANVLSPTHSSTYDDVTLASNTHSSTTSMNNTLSVTPPLVVDDNDATQGKAVEGFVVSATILSLLSGGGAASSISVVMLSFLQCSTQPPVSVATYFVSVFFDFGNTSMGLGNVGLIYALVSLQTTIVWLLLRFRDQQWSPCNRNDRADRYLSAMALVRAPAVGVSAATLLLPGSVMGIVAGYVDESNSTTVDVILCSLALLLCLTIIAAEVVLLRTIVLPMSTFELYEEYSVGSKMEKRFLFPEGRWEPANIRQAFGPLMSSMRRDYPLLLNVELLLSCFVGLVSGLFIGGACATWLLAAASVMYFLYAIVLVVLRPHRMPLDRLCAPLIYILLGVLFSLQFSDTTGSSSASITTTRQALQMVVSALQMIRNCCSFFIVNVREPILRVGEDRFEENDVDARKQCRNEHLPTPFITLLKCDEAVELTDICSRPYDVRDEDCPKEQQSNNTATNVLDDLMGVDDDQKYWDHDGRAVVSDDDNMSVRTSQLSNNSDLLHFFDEERAPHVS